MQDMSPSTVIRLGEVVRYPDPPDQTAERLDGYRNFFNLTDVPGAARLIMNRGIDNPAWVAAAEGRRRPVILIRSNPLRAGTSKTPWEDAFDLDGRRLQYYGDHRAGSEGPPESTRGNAALLAASEEHRAKDQASRASAVPLLIFRSVERNGQTKGYLEFCGLGIICQATLTDQRHPETGASFRNFVYDIALLDLAPEGNEFDWTWINVRRDPRSTIDETNDVAPASWRSWIDTGETDSVDRRYWPGAMTGSDQAAASVRSPDWTRDELLLACAAVRRNEWREIKKYDKRALELSELLQRMPIHPQETRGPDFRNPNSVQRKTADLATARPGYDGAMTRGGRLTQQVAKEFVERPDEMLSAADRIRSALTSTDPALLQAIETPDSDEEEEHTAIEGRVLERLHRFRERDRRLRQAKIDSVLRTGGALACQVCGFDFARRFGTHGNGYIEVHHVVPLHETGTSETRLADLALLCANCHRMSHRRLRRSGTWPSPEELQDLITR